MTKAACSPLNSSCPGANFGLREPFWRWCEPESRSLLPAVPVLVPLLFQVVDAVSGMAASDFGALAESSGRGACCPVLQDPGGLLDVQVAHACADTSLQTFSGGGTE